MDEGHPITDEAWRAARAFSPMEAVWGALGCLLSLILLPILSPYLLAAHLIRRAFLKRFTRQLAMLLESGVPLFHAIILISHQHQGKLSQKVFDHLEQSLEVGENLSKAMKEFPRTFPAHYRDTIAWAERRGNPHDLVLALRLLSGETDYQPGRQPVGTEEQNRDVLARRLRG